MVYSSTISPKEYFIMGFNVLLPHPIIEQFPLEIACLDQIGSKLFVGTTDGSLLEYDIEEDPFVIHLTHVHKQVQKGLLQMKILLKSRSLALLDKGSLFKCQ